MAEPTSSCPIQGIPLEVLLRITYHLTTPELGNFRLACRSIEQSLYITFTREFFTLKQFMITEDSLQALIDISKSRLAHHLRSVHIGLECFPEGMHRPLQDEERESRFRQRYADQFSLWNTGYHREMLAEAFGNLENLENVVIRDFNSRRRTRDGINAEWTSYGSTTFFKETGVRLNQGHVSAWNATYPSQYCSQVFAAAMAALGQAKARPTGIEIMSRNGNHLRDFAFNIPQFTEASILPVLENLKKLYLCVDFTWRNSISTWPGASTHSHRTAPYLLIRKFISHCPNLEKLRINENHAHNLGLCEMLQWLAAPAQASTAPAPPTSPPQALGIQSPPPVLLPHLQELSFGTMRVESGQILAVVRKFAPSLKRLELWKITLIRALPDNSTGPSPKVIFWTKFLEKLREIPNLDLHHIKAGMLQQQWAHSSNHVHLQFKDVGPVQEYTGPDWKHFVEEITGRLEANWLTDGSDSEGWDEDASDEDEDVSEEETSSVED
ncbi:hypothetical protein HJFPF1_11562 [Paramyrothecium foliicola]|nr:hypothetical protein HJFPF1_11562 [Paramyrothecium foliicola]